MDEIGDVAAGDPLHIGTEIFRPVRFQPAHHFHARKIRLDVYSDKGITLVVFEQDIIGRLVLFDEIVFKDERFHFVARDDVIESVYLGDHARDLFRLDARVEILAHPVFQHLGFADIEYLSRLGIHDVNSALFGQVFYLLPQNIVHVFILSRARISRKKNNAPQGGQTAKAHALRASLFAPMSSAASTAGSESE